MNTLRNSVRLVGNLGMDPEVKNFENNKKLTRLSIATNESYKNDKRYHFCYEYGYLPLDGDELLLVKREDKSND